MTNAEEEFRAKLARQSRTLPEAVAEYKRRYKRNPPVGFDTWFEYAKEGNFVMIDEFDGLMKDLEPFWEISGDELRQRARQAAELPSIDLVSIRDGKWYNGKKEGFKDSEQGARAHGFRVMLEAFAHLLPDLDFPINAKAEDRVVIPWEHRQFPNMTEQDSSKGIEAMLGGRFDPDWGHDGNVWNAWRRSCKPTDPARRLFASTRMTFSAPAMSYLDAVTDNAGPGSEFSFVPTPAARTTDFCQTPESHYTQGHFFSDWRTIPKLYPIFSPANTQGFYDIKVPSHYYYGSTKKYTYGWDPVNLELKEVDDMEVPWDEKSDKIFWRGATTGGGSHPPGFSMHYQRHRFLRMASDDSDTLHSITFADPPTTGHYVTAQVPIKDLNAEIMDTAFVKATTSATDYPGGLAGLMADHRFADSVPLGRHWAFKYLVDLDGQSYSGRFMAFLASDSVPLKATVYDEYYSDWIQPWVHFIPLSASYKEIYNIHTFFSGGTKVALEQVNSSVLYDTEMSPVPSDGDARLRRIARAGKEWKRTMGRPFDMEIYVYRLCLEYARLSADDRESMDFVG
ncbi:hypothetical protein FISHEDRAFT_45273 [Fistulina hepatica ATCC 64428]|uniref:Glycosyl transferase CAP10 domain-containing protein n=1 Tax=Fistulina hepatica ATCC 64428 TaxID=1128425 RepID=A0A0D7A8Y8_9AGAR|nr:hypothetical protein FISHEDRAFT_45273 [Fistulina hepatica ATCC 64428]